MVLVGEEAEAKNFVLYIGHLRGDGSHWCNRLPLRKRGGEIVSRKILVVLIALFVFVVMLFTMGSGFAQTKGGGAKAEPECKDGVIEAKPGGVVSKQPCETQPTP
jgi:hypothetical protein